MKRSAQVALLLMGAAGVGAGTYAMTSPRKDCIAPGTRPSATAPAVPGSAVAPATPGSAMAPAVAGKPALEPCPPRRSRSSSGGYYYRSYWPWGGSGRDARQTSSRSTTPAGSVPFSSRSGSGGSRGASGGVSRGGFGSSGRASSSS